MFKWHVNLHRRLVEHDACFCVKFRSDRVMIWVRNVPLGLYLECFPWNWTVVPEPPLTEGFNRGACFATPYLYSCDHSGDYSTQIKPP